MAVAENQHGHRVVAPGTHVKGQARDPVCGMSVDPATSKHRVKHGGAVYHFCGAGCAAKFTADPTKYSTPSVVLPRPAAAKGTIYTCPMHPEIRTAEPGTCPICGMALEPVGVPEDTGPSAELIDMTRRFWVGAALAVPVVILDMAADLPGFNLRRYIGPEIVAWTQF